MEVTTKTFVHSELGQGPRMAKIMEGTRSPSPCAGPVVRSKVNSIANAGGLKARNTNLSPRPRSPVRSPSPERLLRQRSNTHLVKAPVTASPKPQLTMDTPSLRIPKNTTNIFGTPPTHSRSRNASLSGKSSLSSLSPARTPMPKFGLTPSHSSSGRTSPARQQVGEDQPTIRVTSKVSKISRPQTAIVSPTQEPSPPPRTQSSPRGGINRIPVRRPSPERAVSPDRRVCHTRNGSETMALSINNHSKRHNNDTEGHVYIRPGLSSHSPPASTVSFTSQSTSISSRLQSPISDVPQSGAENTEASRRAEIVPHVISLLGGEADSEQEVEESLAVMGEEEEKTDDEQATAKSNRRTADLEIRNRSLLIINGNLETTKHRLTKEVHELRRKLREARLALPPSRFRMLKETDPEFVKDLLEGHLTSARESVPSDGKEESEEEEEEEELGESGGGDERYERVTQMVGTMLAAGRRALESEVGVGVGVQVLHADEVGGVGDG